MSEPKIELWMELAAWQIQDLPQGCLTAEIAAIIARHAPATLERELAEALRAMESAEHHNCSYSADAVCAECDAIAKARAVLRKYEAKHPPTPAPD